MGVMQWFRPVRVAALEGHVAPGERLLASATSEDGVVVAATLAQLLVVREGAVSSHGWCEVAGAGWSSEGVLTVLWVEGGPELQVALGRGGRACARVVRERVDASMVAVREVEVAGRTVGHVALRKHPVTCEVFAQEMWARAGRRTDPVQVEAMRVAALEFDGVVD